MAKKQVKRRSTDEEFVKAWVAGGTILDVADRLDMAVQSVYVRARKLREAGVNLPTLERGTRGPRVIDAKALNTIIKGAK